MLRKRLTDTGLEKLSSEDGRLEIWDMLQPGLGVRVGPRRKSFFAMVRVHGKLRRLSLGVHPGVKVAEARSLARDALTLAQSGIDPAARRRDERDKAERARLRTVSVVVEEFVERYAKPRLRTWKDTEVRLRPLVRAYGNRPIGDLTRTDVVRMLDDLGKGGMGVGVNRVLTRTKTFMSWCVERGLIDQSAAEHVRAPAVEISRDRVLSDAELALVWRAAEKKGHPFGAIVQLLILTGQRRDEVGRLAWAEIDYAAREWLIPATRNKSGRPHSVHLTQAALEVLNGIEETGPMVFPTQTDLQGTGSFSGYSRAKSALDKSSGVSGWRLHDLRRTAATGMARLGFEPHVVERVLNHASSAAGPLSRVYQRYSYDAEKAAALEAWSDHVRALTAPRQQAAP